MEGHFSNMLSYGALLEKTKEVEQKLLASGLVTKPISGRFKAYQRMIGELDDAWTQKKMADFYKKGQNDKYGFALKELREMVDIFEQLLVIYGNLSTQNKKELQNRVRQILSGPDFTVDETPANSAARNFQFELRLAAKFIQNGYHDIGFQTNPDLLISVDDRKYGFECKRILGLSERSVIENALKAIKQLDVHKDNYFGGVVAIDVSAQYEQGQKWLKSKTRDTANTYALDELQKYVQYLYNRLKQLREAASDGFVVAIWMNLSTVYVLENSELGWIQESGVLVLDKENPNGKIFVSDFGKMQPK